MDVRAGELIGTAARRGEIRRVVMQRRIDLRFAITGAGLALAVLWGAAFVATRIGLDSFSPSQLTALRRDIADALYELEELKARITDMEDQLWHMEHDR